jgi:hypothetical protein
MIQRGGRNLRHVIVLVLTASLATALFAGCESTQSKSARLEKNSVGVAKEGGLVVRKSNPDVRVLWTQALQDQNGTAVVVAMKNTGSRAFARLPVAIDVKGAKGKSLFKNDAPGLQTSLTEAPLVRPRGTLLWVNDQVTAAEPPQIVKARVGLSKRRLANPPRISIAGIHLREDPVDGLEAVGRVTNHSPVEQRKLVIYGVARKGRTVVAAGRALVSRLKPKKPARFQLFFIGNPRKGRLTVTAPPTVL